MKILLMAALVAGLLQSCSMQSEENDNRTSGTVITLPCQ